VSDPRDDAQRAEVALREQEIVDELEARGLERLARQFERVRLLAVTDPDMPPDIAASIARLSDLPQPVAVFLSTEPGTVPDPPEAEGGAA
jgi:hypothetical protein